MLNIIFDLDDTLLASFLVGSKNSLERSKHILDTYLTNRTTCPDFYQSRDPCDEDFRKVNKYVWVAYFKLGRYEKISFKVYFQVVSNTFYCTFIHLPAGVSL